MKKYLLLLLLSLFVVRCSNAPQKSTPPLTADSTFTLEPTAKNTDVPRALTPSANSKDSLSLPASSGPDAAITAIAFGLSAAFSTNPQSEDLNGTCLYGDPNTLALTSPCIRVNVKLLDEKNTVLATTETNENGNFRFYIPKESSYFIQVTDRKGRSSQLNKKAGRGSVVSLYLKP